MESENDRKREELLRTAAALIATRDKLLICAELLREHQFGTDAEGLRAATSVADALIDKVRCAPTTKLSE